MKFKKTTAAAVMAAVVGCCGFYAPVASAVTKNCANNAGKIGYSVKQTQNKNGFYDYSVQARSNKGKTVTAVIHDGNFGGTWRVITSRNGVMSKVYSGQAWGKNAYFTCDTW